MGQLFSKGQKILSPSGTEYKIDEFLGGGGQGEVYRVSSNGKDWAFKWIFPHLVTEEQKKSIESLIHQGAPTDKFLWPLELVTSSKNKGFGYIMPLRQKNYHELTDLLMQKIHPNFYSLTTAGFNLADSFFYLHIKGLAYMDISLGNVFLDPRTGDIQICDNDNVTINRGKTTIVGTPRFKAPEVVRGEAMPSTDTDRFSLAVLLFYMLFLHHPLEGKKSEEIPVDQNYCNLVFGVNPVFIFDPNNKTNTPDPRYQKNPIEIWPIYPQFIKDLFIRTFTQGLRDTQNGRVTEAEWKSAFLRLRDSIIYCPKCGAENFYDLDTLNKNGTLLPKCWHCKSDIPLPPRIKMGDLNVMLTHNTKLFQYHIEPRSYDIKTTIAEISIHPTNPKIWGLKNVSERNWLVTKTDNSKIELPPGKNLPLSNGCMINFGKSEGEIEL
jgi:serine/threonine protein kinase